MLVRPPSWSFQRCMFLPHRVAQHTAPAGYGSEGQSGKNKSQETNRKIEKRRGTAGGLLPDRNAWQIVVCAPAERCHRTDLVHFVACLPRWRLSRSMGPGVGGWACLVRVRYIVGFGFTMMMKNRRGGKYASLSTGPSGHIGFLGAPRSPRPTLHMPLMPVSTPRPGEISGTQEHVEHKADPPPESRAPDSSMRACPAGRSGASTAAQTRPAR